MRHVAALVAAIIIAPLAWVLIAFGQDRSAQAFANAQSNGGFDAADFLRPLVFLAAAGILLGLIATLQFSPVGAGTAGVLYVASYAMLLLAPGGWLRLFRHHLSVAGRQADLSTPIRTGTSLLLGAVLLVAVVSVSRWRRRRPGTSSPSGGLFDEGTTAADRPLGADGLGLTGPEPRTEPAMAATVSQPGSAGAGAGAGGWGDSLPSGSDDGWTSGTSRGGFADFGR